MRLLFGFLGVYALSEDHEAIEQEFGDEIDKHVEDGDEVFVPEELLSQVLLQQSREGSEDGLVSQDLEHGYGDIVGAVECEFPVQREIPDDGKN